jgi:hypothetical protein
MRMAVIMRDEHHFSAGEGAPTLKGPPKDGNRIVDLPVVCTLKPATIATRKATLLPASSDGPDSREETTAGIRLRLPADALSAIFETVDVERQCCRHHCRA